MKEDILGCEYNDPLELDFFAEQSVNLMEESFLNLSKSIKESKRKGRKHISSKMENDTSETGLQAPPNRDRRQFRRVEIDSQPWDEDQSLYWPDYEAEAFERELEQFRQRPESNTGYDNKALNKLMIDMFGDVAKKIIDDKLFKDHKRDPQRKRLEKILKKKDAIRILDTE